MINSILIFRLFLVVAVGLVVLKRTGDKKKAAIAAGITLVIIWGLSFIADQFME